MISGKIYYSGSKIAGKPRKCPIYSEDFKGYPALFRKDNETEICSECGMKEAIQQYQDYVSKRDPKWWSLISSCRSY